MSKPLSHTSTTVARRSRPSPAARRERRAAYLFMAPDLLGLSVFVGLPMVLSVVLAFFRISGFGDYEFIGLDNYRRLINDPTFLDSLQVTLVYVGLLVPGVFCASLGLALLVRRKMPFVGVFRTLLFLPNVVSVVVVGLVWQFMLSDQTGVVSRIMRAIGFDPPSWLGDPNFALGSVIGITIWALMGYYMIIFLAGLQDIPSEYYESARIDGASARQSFAHITWPLLKPTSFFVLLMTTVAAITGAFDLIYVLTSGGPANGTSVAIYYIYEQAFLFGEYGYAAAMGSFLVLVMLACAAVIFHVTRGGRFSYDD